MSDSDVLREGARIMREAVGPEAWVTPMIAAALVAEADRLDRGEPVEGLVESLALAQSFINIETAGADQ